MSYLQELREAASARRARLWGSTPVASIVPVSIPKFLPLRRPEPPAAIVPITPLPAAHGAPLNFLGPCSSRFIIAYCALKHAIPVREIIGRGRMQAVAAARFEAMGLIYQHTQASLPQVGTLFGRDHTTVLSSIRKIGRTKKLVEKSVHAVRFERPQQAHSDLVAHNA